MSSDPEGPGRKLPQYLYLLGNLMIILVLPLIFHYFLETTVAGWAIIISLVIIAFFGGMFDAISFRYTWSFPILFGVVFWISAALYYPPGAWLYAFLFGLVAFLGDKLGSTVKAKE